MNINMYNTTDHLQEYYITPYTFFTIFCFIWVSGAIFRLLTGPFKIIYAFMMGLFRVVYGLVYLSKRVHDR